MITARTAATRGLAIAAFAGLAMTSHAQLLITEVLENAPGSTDPEFEYIEIYGRPGMSLDGYAIGQLKGGFDQNGDDIPDGSSGDNIPEIDEAYALDGLSLGANGFLVLYNDNDSNSAIPFLGDPDANYVTFEDAHIPSTDGAGSLNNDGSSTYALVRLRANPNNFRKEILLDANFDGKADFGTEQPPFFGGATPLAVAPFQRVNELAWSNGGGKEYVADSQDEISDTPGYNPDAVSRVNYFQSNPVLGSRTVDDGMGGFTIVNTRIADESFVYGEIPVASIQIPETLEYDTSIDSDGNTALKAPTDPNATPYDGSCDPEPFNPGPNPACAPNPAGAFLFTDFDVAGFALTPGGYNDGPASGGTLFQIRLEAAQDAASLPAGFDGQFWREGDFNLDGAIDCDDIDLIAARLGATLDDTTPGVDPQGQPFTDYRWQNAEFQQMLMMLHLDTTDGPGGANSDAITQADVDAAIALLDPPACPGDNGDRVIDGADLLLVVNNFGASGTPCSINGDGNLDGVVDGADLLAVINNFGNTCP